MSDAIPDLSRVIQRLEATRRINVASRQMSSLEDLLGGVVEETERGRVLVVRRRFEAGHLHGRQLLDAARGMADAPLVLVSNRGPVTFGPGGEIRRGTGGLVTALIGLASHRDVTWIASAMTDEDVLAGLNVGAHLHREARHHRREIHRH